MHKKHLQSPGSICDIGCRHMNRMWQALGINGNVAFDARDFFTSVISFMFSRIRIFHALCINDTEAGFLCPTIVLSDLSNQFFLKLAPEYCLIARLFSRSTG